MENTASESVLVDEIRFILSTCTDIAVRLCLVSCICDDDDEDEEVDEGEELSSTNGMQEQVKAGADISRRRTAMRMKSPCCWVRSAGVSTEIRRVFEFSFLVPSFFHSEIHFHHSFIIIIYYHSFFLIAIEDHHDF